MCSLESIYKHFSKRIESGESLTISDVKKTEEFNKLDKTGQKQFEELLIKKIAIVEQERKLGKKSKKKRSFAEPKAKEIKIIKLEKSGQSGLKKKKNKKKSKKK